jgi:hypothetical protein
MKIPGIDLTKLDIQAVTSRLPHIPTDKVVTLAKDAAYTTVGFGVLAFQKTQVRRREITEEIQAKLPAVATEAVTKATSALTNLRGLVKFTKPSATEQHN